MRHRHTSVGVSRNSVLGNAAFIILKTLVKFNHGFYLLDGSLCKVIISMKRSVGPTTWSIPALTFWSTVVFHCHIDVIGSLLDDDCGTNALRQVDKGNAHWLYAALV